MNLMTSLAASLRRFGTWHWFVGANPHRCPPRSLILFPYYPATFFCGLAGILVIKGPGPLEKTGIVRTFITLFDVVSSLRIADIQGGALTLARYLDGDASLEKMARRIPELKGDHVFRELTTHPETAFKLERLAGNIKAYLLQEEAALEKAAAFFDTQILEKVNRSLLILRDILWALENDVLATLEQIQNLAEESSKPPGTESLLKYKRINFLLNCINRLEVRGRDSAGLQVSFTLPAGSVFREILHRLKERNLYTEFSDRVDTADLLNNSISLPCTITDLECIREDTSKTITFTYKTASVIGELGQNVRELTESIRGDHVLRVFAETEMACESSFCHTRWASVGSISVENCHPINNATLNGHPQALADKNYPRYGRGNWTINVALNGDIDNYQILRYRLESGHDLIAPEVTTDTKIIPLQIEHYLMQGCDLEAAFRLALNDFEGSHAIAMVSNLEPGKVFLALRGSGQALYIGLADDQYLFSSELYGLVERTPFFIKINGEMPADPARPETTGQMFILDQESTGGLNGIAACFYDGKTLLLAPEDIQKAEITTRDIDRGDFRHYFLKEISESAQSVRKTLLGKYRIIQEENGGNRVFFNLGQDVLPDKIRNEITHRRIRRVIVIGHGTAAVAGQAIGDALNRFLKGTNLLAEANLASELSGFSLSQDLSDTLIIPITQSGTTTDTNRAVAMARDRGASVIAIVNRRQSDITTKTDGVFYTSDGRDIEMSVASTKAFYSQIIAGHLLALFFAQITDALTDDEIAGELRVLEKVPQFINRVLEQQETIRKAAQQVPRQKSHWAIVGSGPNKAAADEIRIKLSELCYKTISSDIVENKKHIDLSAEPLIIVCGAGNPETVVGDIVKDVAIFKAHKAGVVVFTDEGETRFDDLADAVIKLPKGSAPLPVISNTVAGHLFGYYAALGIDEDAMFLRRFRSELNRRMIEQDKQHWSIYERIADREFRKLIRDFSRRFHERRNQGAFHSASAKTISDIVLLLKYTVGRLPLEDYAYDFKGQDDLLSPIDFLDVSLGNAIDELSRPVDAIRHQAKTVTVGTSRKEQPLHGILFDLLKELAFSDRTLASKNILDIDRLQPAVAEIRGYTLYLISALNTEGNPTEETTISIAKRSGVSLQMSSRVEKSGRLMGTKRTIVNTGHLYIGCGKSDGAPLIVIPLKKGGDLISHLLLIHVRFNERITLRERIAAMGVRYNDLKNLINEYNLLWMDRYLLQIPLETLLGEPVEIIAGQIKLALADHPNTNSGLNRDL
jgi:glucosamine--fructose-6-phosphate aminotransferase (isomerizing)